MTMTTQLPIDSFDINDLQDVHTVVESFGGFKTYTNHLAAFCEANPGVFLGFLAWYTVPESVSMNYTDFTQAAIEVGADVAVKKAPHPADIFLRACTSTEGSHRKLPTDQPNTYMNYLVRKSGTDTNFICKQVVREMVDQDNKMLDFEILGDVRFNKLDSSIECDSVVSDIEFQTIVMEIKDYCSVWKDLLTAYTIRECFRASMEGPLSAVSVRNAGGVYFININKSAELSAIESLAGKIEGVNLNILPLLDDGTQRSMLKAAFEDDSVKALQKLMAEMQMLMAKGPVKDKQAAAFQEQYSKLVGKTSEYADILDDSLGTANASLELCKMTITKLFENLETPEKE